jgi:hypothetical protein
MLKSSIILLACIGFASCSNADTNNPKPTSQSERSQTLSADSTVIYFLRWYRDHEEKLNQMPLITGGLRDTTTNYSMNFPATEEYLSELKSSGYLSDVFLNDLRLHFKRADEYFKKNPQNDGPAHGFEADLILKAQDYMDVWAGLDSARLMQTKINGNAALVQHRFLGYYTTSFFLSKQGGRWLTDSLGTHQ